MSIDNMSAYGKGYFEITPLCVVPFLLGNSDIIRPRFYSLFSNCFTASFDFLFDVLSFCRKYEFIIITF